MQTPTWTFQDRIRKAREHAGLNQSALAEKLEVAPGTIQRWETGVRSPSKKSLQALAEVTGVPLEWFYADSEDPSASPSALHSKLTVEWTPDGIQVAPADK